MIGASGLFIAALFTLRRLKYGKVFGILGPLILAAHFLAASSAFTKTEPDHSTNRYTAQSA